MCMRQMLRRADWKKTDEKVVTVSHSDRIPHASPPLANECKMSVYTNDEQCVALLNVRGVGVSVTWVLCTRWESNRIGCEFEMNGIRSNR